MLLSMRCPNQMLEPPQSESSISSIFLDFVFLFLPLVDAASTVPGLLSIFHEQEMTEIVHDTNGHGYLATIVGKNGR